MSTPTTIAAYLALFFLVGFLFLFLNLMLGWLIRPKNPHAEKEEIYECGEPTIGSSFVQFDLRFYVVALLFIIFDVEVAMFFPWAVVFGKATNLAEGNVAVVETVAGAGASDASLRLTDAAQGTFRELGVPDAAVAHYVAAGEGAASPSAAAATAAIKNDAGRLAAISLVDIAVFFGVLMVGFAYVWMRGDLNWVRALTGSRAETPATIPRRERVGAV
jgi:NADH-quinone oxidoreductase subunit A